MTIPTMDDYNKMLKIQFPENDIPYGCDFSFYSGIPTDVVWGIQKIDNGLIWLVAPGYGLRNPLYGCGSICVSWSKCVVEEFRKVVPITGSFIDRMTKPQSVSLDTIIKELKTLKDQLDKKT